MSKQVYTVTKEGIEYLCGLIRDIVSTPSELISDITLSTNKTMSSVKIDKIIKQCLQDANEYSNEVVNSLTHLMAEKIDFEPTLDNTTDKINTLLLYSANNDNNYTQYLRLTNELLNLGDTSLSFNEYVKVVDADAKYTLKTTTDTLTTEVNNIKSDFTTHKDDTTIHITQTEKDNIINKDDITTTIDSTSTDTQVPSAKAVYNATVDKNRLTYTSLADLGLTTDATMNDIIGAMKDNTTFTYETTVLDYKTEYNNVRLGTVTINKQYISRVQVIMTDKNTGDLYVGRMDNNNLFIGWAKMITENGTRITTLETQVNELFQSVSNGKTLVANAITGRGVSTSATATFATMATNVGKISASSYKEETKSYTTTSSGITPITLTFSANVLGIKQVIPPTYSSRINTQTSSDIFTINGKELIFYVTGEGTWKVTALIEA